MQKLEKEVEEIIKKNGSSLVAQKGHVTNWTHPFGSAIQFSLYNTSGNTSDFSTDHNLSQKDNNGEKMKTFFDESYHNIYKIFKMFEKNVINFRLNGMGENSGLLPHKEYNIHDGKYRIRFHIPIFTSDKSWVMLEGEKFRLKHGIIYFFNNGKIHSAGNEGKETRFHLIFDVWLDEDLFENFLNYSNTLNPYPDMLDLLSEEEFQKLTASEPYDIVTYEDQFEGTKNYGV